MYQEEEGCLGSPQKKAHLFSVISGFMVGLGWMIYIDGAAYGARFGGKTSDVNGFSWLPGVVTTLSFFMINGFNWEYMSPRATEVYRGGNVGLKARLFLFTAILLGFGALIGAIFIFTDNYAGKDHPEGEWPGFAIIIQNFLIFFGAFLMRSGTMVY